MAVQVQSLQPSEHLASQPKWESHSKWAHHLRLTVPKKCHFDRIGDMDSLDVIGRSQNPTIGTTLFRDATRLLRLTATLPGPSVVPACKAVTKGILRR
jgi:hypothetical protein